MRMTTTFRRIPTFLALAIGLTACREKAPPPREFDGSSAFGYIERQLAFGYRIPGTEGHRAMAAWLEERNLDVPSAAEDPSEWDHSEHGHNAMHGMLTHEQLDRLKAARGREFDRVFLRGMIQHHRGAIAMADDAAPESSDVRASEMMGEVAAVQSGEIARMRDLLAELA